MDSLVWPNGAWGSKYRPLSSGPRWANRLIIPSTSAGSMRAVLSRPTFPQMPHMSDFLRGLWGRRRFLSNRICSWSLSVSAGPAFEANRPTQDLEPLGEGSPHGFSSRFANGERQCGSKNDEAGNRHEGCGAFLTERIRTPRC